MISHDCSTCGQSFGTWQEKFNHEELHITQEKFLSSQSIPVSKKSSCSDVEGAVQGAGGVSAEVGLDVEIIESLVIQRDSPEERGDRDCPGPGPQEDEDYDHVEFPEDGVVKVSEGREGFDIMGDGSTGELENGSAESSTVCPECAPIVERMLANITRRVLEQLQEC